MNTSWRCWSDNAAKQSSHVANGVALPRVVKEEVLMLPAIEECSRKKSQMINCNYYDFSEDWDRRTAPGVYVHGSVPLRHSETMIVKSEDTNLSIFITVISHTILCDDTEATCIRR